MYAATQGGHYTELMRLYPLFSKYESILVTSNLNATKDKDELLVFKDIAYSAAMAKRRERMAGKRSYSRWNDFFTYCKVFIECFKIYFKFRPDVIVTTGSYIAVPLFICGKIFGSKNLFIESNAQVYTKSSTGRLVEKLSHKIYVQWPEMLAVYHDAEYHGVLH